MYFGEHCVIRFSRTHRGRQVVSSTHIGGFQSSRLRSRGFFFGQDGNWRPEHSLDVLLRVPHRVPLCIGCRVDQVAVEIRSVVGPPNNAALAEGNLGRVDLAARNLQCQCFAAAPAAGNCAARCHELIHQALPFLTGQAWVGSAPQTPTHNDVAPVRRQRISFQGVACVSHCHRCGNERPRRCISNRLIRSASTGLRATRLAMNSTKRALSASHRASADTWCNWVEGTVEIAGGPAL